MVILALTESEAEYLQDIVQLWAEGYPEATEAVIADNSIDDPEKWLDCVNGMNEGKQAADDIVRKIQVARERTTLANA